MNTQPLKGQSALVTGADSGIGKGVAMELAKAGANVIINHVDAHEVAQLTVDEITAAGGNAYAIHADISKEDEVKSLFNDSGQQIVLVEVRPRQQTLTINIQGRKSLSIEWSTTKFKSALPEDLLADIIQLTGKGVEKLWTSDKAEIDLLSTEPLMSFSSVPEFGATLASDA